MTKQTSGDSRQGGTVRPAGRPASGHGTQRQVCGRHGPMGRLHDVLPDMGVAVPAPESLTDDELGDRLWAVIRALAELGIYFRFTDHLTDREFYAYLYETVLAQVWDFGEIHEGLGLVHTVLTYGSDDYLRYYAPPEERGEHLRQGKALPAPAVRPGARDAVMPQNRCPGS